MREQTPCRSSHSSPASACARTSSCSCGSWRAPMCFSFRFRVLLLLRLQPAMPTASAKRKRVPSLWTSWSLCSALWRVSVTRLPRSGQRTSSSWSESSSTGTRPSLRALSSAPRRSSSPAKRKCSTTTTTTLATTTILRLVVVVVVRLRSAGQC